MSYAYCNIRRCSKADGYGAHIEVTWSSKFLSVLNRCVLIKKKKKMKQQPSFILTWLHRVQCVPARAISDVINWCYNAWYAVPQLVKTRASWSIFSYRETPFHILTFLMLLILSFYVFLFFFPGKWGWWFRHRKQKKKIIKRGCESQNAKVVYLWFSRNRESVPCSGFRFIAVVSGNTTAKFSAKVCANLDAVKVAIHSPEIGTSSSFFSSSILPFTLAPRRNKCICDLSFGRKE